MDRRPTSAEGRRRRRACAWLCCAAALLAVAPPAASAAAPANDAFAAAQAVALPADVPGSNLDATTEVGEPVHAGAGGRSVWFALHATRDAEVVIHTCGASFDTVLAVYTGTAVDALTEVAADDDACGLSSRLRIEITAGTDYRIAVGGFDDASGFFRLSVAERAPPSNDAFAAARSVGLPEQLFATNVDASLEPGEPAHAGATGGNSVWYRFRSHAASALRVETCAASFDTMLAVYTGSAVDALTPVAANDDGCGDGGSRVDVQTAAGSDYYIAVDGLDGATGDFELNVTATPQPPPPPPPPPACPPAGLAAGTFVYRGAHAGGGPVCLTLSPDLAQLTSFSSEDVQGDVCRFRFNRHTTGLAVAERRFATADGVTLTGGFGLDAGASGSFKLVGSGVVGVCTTPVVTWTATADRVPPWPVPPPPDTRPPSLSLGGARIQRPLARNSVAVTVACAAEACLARAAATASTAPRRRRLTLRSSRRVTILAGARATLKVRLSPIARRQIVAALRRNRRVRAHVVVTAVDRAGNAATARRTVTLRR